MRILTLTILTFLLYHFGYSQHDHDWPINATMFFTINPAYTAAAASLTGTVMHARKWHNVKSSPSQSGLGILLPFTNDRMGVGGHLFSEEAGPFKSNGLALSYGYQIPLAMAEQDLLSIGMSIRLMHIAFDQNHLTASEPSDDLLFGIEDNKIVPPSFAAGFRYITGTPDYDDPVQLEIAGSITRVFPFQDRFNTVSFNRSFQWYGLFSLNIATSEKITISPTLLLNDVGQHVFNYAVRLKTAYAPYGWLMAQYSKAGFFTTQLGLNLGASWNSDDLIEVSASHSWYSGTLSAQIGNSITVALTLKKAITKRGF